MPKPEQIKLDELLLSKTRLGIIAALINGDKLDFTFLRDTLGLSDGNLSVQIRKLEQAGYLKVEKVFLARKPKTFCKITPKAQKALRSLLQNLQNMIT